MITMLNSVMAVLIGIVKTVASRKTLLSLLGLGLTAVIAFGYIAIDGLRFNPLHRTIAVLGEMKELGSEADEAHVAIGIYAAELGIDRVVVVGEAATGIATGAGARAVALPDNDAAVAWVREQVAEGDAVLFKASNGARLYDVAEALL